MIGPQFVAAHVRNVWAGAVIVATVLVVAGCEFPGVEQTAPPATPVASQDVGAAAAPTSTPSAGEVATARARATARKQATVEAWATRYAVTAVAAATARVLITPTPPVRVIVKNGRRTICTGFPSAMHSGAKWTADGAHILLTFNAEVWAVTPDGSRAWMVAQAWRDTATLLRPAGRRVGRTTSFDVTPDGKQIVYATCAYSPERLRGATSEQLDEYDFDYELAVVGLDGKAPRRLTRHEAFDNYPAWSPDGTRVAFLSERDASDWGLPRIDLYTMAADGMDVQRLTAGLKDVPWWTLNWQPPAWSPDGRFLAVSGVEGIEEYAQRVLYLVRADGSGFVRLSEAMSGGTWSPDGTRLAFAKAVGDEAGEAGLFTIAVDGSDLRRVGTVSRSGVPNAWIHTVAWSPDGLKLLYVCSPRQFCVVTLDGEPVGATVTQDGRPVGENPLLGDRAAWSPDGERIAVTSQPPRPLVYNGIILYTVAPDGSERQTLAWRGVGLVAAQAKDEDLATSRAACAAGFVVPAPDANPGLVRDCEALLAVRATLFGELLVNWGAGTPLDHWEGVTVTGAPPRVTGLALRGKYLGFTLTPTTGGFSVSPPSHSDPRDQRFSGTIPPALGALDHLRRLDLYGNALAGPIPPELGALRHLTELRLGLNRLKGPIPVELGAADQPRRVGTRTRATERIDRRDSPSVDPLAQSEATVLGCSRQSVDGLHPGGPEAGAGQRSSAAQAAGLRGGVMRTGGSRRHRAIRGRGDAVFRLACGHKRAGTEGEHGREAGADQDWARRGWRQHALQAHPRVAGAGRSGTGRRR